jgi:hypothetical protein
MARRAASISTEQLLTACCVADLYRHAARVESGTDVCDDANEFVRLQVERRHATATDPASDYVAEVLVRLCPSELSKAEVNRVFFVAVRAMAQRALGCIDTGARLDGGTRVLVVTERLCGNISREAEHKQERSECGKE